MMITNQQEHEMKYLGPARHSLPMVSVGCAVYNGAQTLRRALDGLVKQDYPNVEIIIADDGSTDGSKEICREYCAKFPNITLVENPENLGIFRNCNNLFELSSGKYFMWADQDDVRDPTFISKCVAILESDSGCVLCHSHTGVFWKTFANLMHVNTIDYINDVSSVLVRYWRFLRRYSDTTIYGLIRADALRRTRMWQAANASSNALLFELLLLGKFRQIPEVLYYYCAKGLRYRPSPDAEYARSNSGRRRPKWLMPFLVLATNQSRAIISAHLGWVKKIALLAILWGHIAMVNAAKLAYRIVAAAFGRNVPRFFERWCEDIVEDLRDIRFVVRPEDDRDYYPQGWRVRRTL